MVATEGIKISEATKKGLDGLKTHPRETYDDVISRLWTRQSELDKILRVEEEEE